MRMTNGPGEFQAQIACESCPTALMSRISELMIETLVALAEIATLLTDRRIARHQHTIQLDMMRHGAQRRLIRPAQGDDVAGAILVGLERDAHNPVVARARRGGERRDRRAGSNRRQSGLIAGVDARPGRRQRWCWW